jgi:hypothetical protein
MNEKRPPPARYSLVALRPLAVLLALASPQAAWAAADDNLLARKAPQSAAGVDRAERLTDGTAAPAGDFWKTDLTATFRDAQAYVVYDLGAVVPIAAAWLQGDNNDTYAIEVSRNGDQYQTLWKAGPEPAAGLRARHQRGLTGEGRFVRISAAGGDGAFSLSEVKLYSTVPAVFPPPMEVSATGVPYAQKARSHILNFGVALIAAVLLAYRGAPVLWTLLVLAWPLFAGVLAFIAFREASPVDTRVVSLARATWALVSAVVVLRECFPPTRFQADRRITLGVLGLTATLSFLSFYNLGQPQFWDARRGQSTFIHYPDLRQYHPTAKYFKELGYRGIYVADMAAYREEPGVDAQQVDRMPMRDLDTLAMSTVGAGAEQMKQVKARFTPERWEEYKRDARYLREVMGTAQYLDYMHDMGGNATPVWMSTAHLLWSALPASNGAFLFTAVFDLVLLLLTFVVVGRTFGVRTALLVMVVFGSNDFIMYGTNWAGSTLRHDWMAYLGLGACALKSGRHLLGGVLLGAAAMARAFPALAIFGVILPVLWRIADHWRARRAPPSLAEILAQNRVTMRILLGAGAAVLVLFAFSAGVLSVRSWGDWLHKVGDLSADPHPSHISLRSLVAGADWNQYALLRQRLPVFIAGILFFVVTIAIAARDKPPERAALLALPLIPVLMYPANYYIHFVCLLPLLVEERRQPEAAAPGATLPPLSPTDAGIWTALLLMCVAQYGTVLVPELGLHFYLSSVLLFATLATVLLFLARERALAAGWFRTEDGR